MRGDFLFAQHPCTMQTGCPLLPAGMAAEHDELRSVAPAMGGVVAVFHTAALCRAPPATEAPQMSVGRLVVLLTPSAIVGAKAMVVACVASEALGGGRVVVVGLRTGGGGAALPARGSDGGGGGAFVR